MVNMGGVKEIWKSGNEKKRWEGAQKNVSKICCFPTIQTNGLSKGPMSDTKIATTCWKLGDMSL